MTPLCHSCGARTMPAGSRAAEPHRATCPWGDPDFIAKAMSYYRTLLKAGVFA